MKIFTESFKEVTMHFKEVQYNANEELTLRGTITLNFLIQNLNS